MKTFEPIIKNPANANHRNGNLHVPSSNEFNNLSQIRNANKRMNDARNLPHIKQLMSVIWLSNELHLLFADTGVGKSILGVGIADALSKGRSFMNLENENNPLTVLYYDFELSDKQFFKRYTDDRGNSYTFSEYFFIDNIDFAVLTELNPSKRFHEILFDKIRHDIELLKANVLFIDNLTFLNTQTTEDTQIALEVMRKLNELKKEYNLSIMVLAHTPKRNLSNPLTVNDLAGSKHLSNFADSISAIGKSTLGASIRYIKQIKPSRSSEPIYTTDNVITCEISKNGTFLSFELIGFCNENEHLRSIDEQVWVEKKQLVLSLHQQGNSLRDIAREIGVGKSTVQRWIKETNIDTVPSQESQICNGTEKMQ